MNTIQMYDVQANSINVEDIASNDKNRLMLSRIKRNSILDTEHEDLWIQNEHDDVEEEKCIDYVPEGASDMGWLGYFVGKSNHLKGLYIRDFEPSSGASVLEVLEPFFRGVNNNKSINILSFDSMDLLGGKIFTMMAPFFENNPTIINLDIRACNRLGDEGWSLLGLALGNNKHKSLTRVVLENNNISDQELVDIIIALSMHPRLEHLDLDGNRLGINGCKALATLLQHSATELEHLDISNNEIGDDGMNALVPALKHCSHLQNWRLCNTISVTKKGWQQVASILEAPNSNLKELNIYGSTYDDEILAAFANSLANNHTLTALKLSDNPSITAKGWEAFSKLLCNTASVNTTFLSNHSLYDSVSNPTVTPLLALNRRGDKKGVAMVKILLTHDDFDMMPFFEWEFKVLPLMINWFERASAITMPRNVEPNIGPRKLSSIYQFVRGMPDLYVETRLRKELEDIKAEQSQMEEEFRRRKQFLQDRETSIMERLGPR